LQSKKKKKKKEKKKEKRKAKERKSDLRAGGCGLNSRHLLWRDGINQVPETKVE
jgi:hypothetical protein